MDRARALTELAEVLVWMGEPEDAPAHPRLIRVHARADLSGRAAGVEGSLPVSSKTGAGLGDLTRAIACLSRTVLPSEGEIALNGRQAASIGEARDSLQSAAVTTDIVILAESLRQARSAFDRLTGRAGVEDLLDALFGRFCLGK
jgi:tRNA modification GTPase